MSVKVGNLGHWWHKHVKGLRTDFGKKEYSALRASDFFPQRVRPEASYYYIHSRTLRTGKQYGLIKPILRFVSSFTYCARVSIVVLTMKP